MNKEHSTPAKISLFHIVCWYKSGLYPEDAYWKEAAVTHKVT